MDKSPSFLKGLDDLETTDVSQPGEVEDPREAMAATAVSADPLTPAVPGGLGSNFTTPQRGWLTFSILALALVGSIAWMFGGADREIIGLIAILQTVILIFLRMPVAFAMLIPALLGMWALRGFRLVESAMSGIVISETASWSLSVIPMFILMGMLVWSSGMAKDLYDAASKWLWRVPGSLAIGTNTAGAGLAAVSGSTIGTTYALARIGIPEMLRAGYNKRVAILSVIAAGLPGQLIPPSILLVIYAGIAEVPVGEQLMAGVIPGLIIATLAGLVFLGIAIIKPSMAGISGDHTREALRPAPGEKLRSLRGVWPVPLLIFVIVVGMFSGFFTATEAGAAAALVAFIVALIKRPADGETRMGTISKAAVGAVSSTGSIFLMLIGAVALSQMLTLTGVTQAFSGLIESWEMTRVEFILVMVVVYLVMGMAMESLPMMLLTVPVLMPTLEYLDISAIWFGVFAVLMGEVATISPPVGILTFIIHSVVREPEVNMGQNITMRDVFMAVVWILPVVALLIVIMVIFPEVTNWLPSLMAKS